MLESFRYRQLLFSLIVSGISGCGSGDSDLTVNAVEPVAATESAIAVGPFAALPLAAAPSPGVASSDIVFTDDASSIRLDCTDGAVEAKGPYMTENNLWGKASAIGPFSQCAGIGSISADGSVSARWQWDWPRGDQGVKGTANS